MKLAATWSLVKDTGKQFLAHKGTRLGAALAYYTALSISPLLLVVVAIAGAVFGEQAAHGEVADQIENTVGHQGAEAIQSMLAAHTSHSTSLVMTIVGVVALVVAATGVFAQLQDALDTIWDAKPDPKAGIWTMVKDRLLSFSVVCGLAFLLLASLVFSAILSALSGWLDQWLPVGAVQIANQALAFVLTAVLFAFIFKVLPHARPAWSDVWHGALVTAVLFAIGKYLIGLYLGHAAPGSAYGAAGSFVVLLIWIYYSSQILLFGAEFTHVYARSRGSRRDKDVRHPGAPTPDGSVERPAPVGTAGP
jgi:membrane protein